MDGVGEGSVIEDVTGFMGLHTVLVGIRCDVHRNGLRTGFWMHVQTTLLL
jgi:hypothetical protein